MSRKVLIQRVQGPDHPHVPLGMVHEGWEMAPPTVGKRYTLFKDNGAVFRSSRVVSVEGEIFRTFHSTYSLRVLDRMAPPR